MKKNVYLLSSVLFSMLILLSSCDKIEEQMEDDNSKNLALTNENTAFGCGYDRRHRTQSNEVLIAENDSLKIRIEQTQYPDSIPIFEAMIMANNETINKNKDDLETLCDLEEIKNEVLGLRSPIVPPTDPCYCDILLSSLKWVLTPPEVTSLILTLRDANGKVLKTTKDATTVLPLPNVDGELGYHNFNLQDVDYTGDGTLTVIKTLKGNTIEQFTIKVFVQK